MLPLLHDRLLGSGLREKRHDAATLWPMLLPLLQALAQCLAMQYEEALQMAE